MGAANDERLGAMIVAAGEMGERHAQHWTEAGVSVVAVFDPDSRRASALAARYGARSVGSLEEGLEVEGVDVVSVCSPTFLHARHTITSLKARKHVLCEKPAALDLGEAQAMREAERGSGRRLRIGFMRRFDAASRKVLGYGQALGFPLLAQATIAAGVRPKLLMHDATANGGPIIDMCCHIFDQWALLFGEQPCKVRAHGYTFSADKPEVASIERKALDSAHLTLAYPGGGVGQVQVSWGLPRGISPLERHTYMGPEGLVTVEWPTEVVLHGGEGDTRWTNRGADPWRTEIAAFASELRGGDPGRLATIQDGIAALRTSLAVLQSVAEEREVVLSADCDELSRGAP